MDQKAKGLVNRPLNFCVNPARGVGFRGDKDVDEVIDGTYENVQLDLASLKNSFFSVEQSAPRCVYVGLEELGVVRVFRLNSETTSH